MQTFEPVVERKMRRAACSRCRRVQADADLIRAAGERFCAPCWFEAVETFAPRIAGGETLSRYYQRTYGIDTTQYGEMYLQQRGKCAICQRRPKGQDPLAVDHDHATGKVRGLLCRGCNTGLGCFEDDMASLGRAVAYLADHSVSPSPTRPCCDEA